jgi:hypothetical protein
MQIDDHPLGTKDRRQAIAQKIDAYLKAKGLQRKKLVNDFLPLTTLEKVFQGEFSEKTLRKIEVLLDTTFAPGGATYTNPGEAPQELGSYTLSMVDALQGDYLAVRPLFDQTRCLNAYIIRIAWDPAQARLVFTEHNRPDERHTQHGDVSIAFGSRFWNLVSMHMGSIRVTTLFLPMGDGLCRGLIATISNPRGNVLLPAAAPMFLKRLAEGERPDVGYITADAPAFAEYQSILESVIAEDYGCLVPPPTLSPTERRQGMTLVKPE